MSREYENTLPVFRLKPISGTNSCTVKLVGYVNENDRIADERVEFKTDDKKEKTYGKNVDYVGNIMGYDITVYMFRNNILGSFILDNDFLPVYSISFMYSKNIVSGHLFDIFLGLDLDTHSKNIKNSPGKIHNSQFSGQYKLKLVCDENVANTFQTFYDSIPEQVVSTPDIANKVAEMSESEFSLFLTRNIVEKQRTFNGLMKCELGITSFVSHTKTIETVLRPLYSNDNLNILIKYCLEKKEETRRKDYGAIEKFELPKRVLNIRDVERDPSILNNYF